MIRFKATDPSVLMTTEVTALCAGVRARLSLCFCVNNQS